MTTIPASAFPKVKLTPEAAAAFALVFRDLLRKQLRGELPDLEATPAIKAKGKPNPKPKAKPRRRPRS